MQKDEDLKKSYDEFKKIYKDSQGKLGDQDMETIKTIMDGKATKEKLEQMIKAGQYNAHKS
jgi:hypothetical protein